jgi:hypothetical protein
VFFFFQRIALSVAALGLATSPTCADTLLSFDFNQGHLWLRSTSTNSWGVTRRQRATTTALSITTREAPVAAITLQTDFTRAHGKAKAAFSSGVLDLRNNEANLAKLTLSFDVWMRELRPVRVVVQSLDASGSPSGSRYVSLLPPVKEAWYRIGLDLDKTKPLEGRFNPRAPQIQLFSN